MLAKSGSHYQNLIKAESFNATQALLRRERFVGEIYEAYRHDDGICEAFVANGNAVYMTCHDFLTETRGCTNVATEPPSELGDAYVRKALELVTGKVAMLLPVVWMATEKMRTLVAETPLARVYILTKRLRFRKEPMAWFVFEKGHFETPIIIIIPSSLRGSTATPPVVL